MNKNQTRQKVILLALILAAVLMLILLAVGSLKGARIQSALEEMRDRIEANKTPTTTAPGEPIKTNGYLSLKNGTIGSMKLYYYGDDTLYGRGTGNTPAVMVEGAVSTLLHRAIGATYGRGNSIGGRILTYTGSVYSTEVAAYDFEVNLYLPMDFRLAILAPSDAILEKNRETFSKDDYAGSLSGEVGKDVETLVSSIRTTAPRCDILLAVPHNASDSLAEVILAIGEHYGLVTVDLRPIGAMSGMIHESGEDAGYPTAEGHRAIADCLAAALAEAVERGHYTTGVPSTKLY